MKKLLLILLSLIMCISVFASCDTETDNSSDASAESNSESSVGITESSTNVSDTSSVVDDSTDASKQTESLSNIKVSYFHADWPQYDSVESLIEASSNVFEGKLTNISFDVVDLYTGESANKASEASKLHIYTIYEVEVNTSYKGVNADKVYIKVIGGMEGYMESKQFDKLKEYDIYDENVGLLVLDCFEPLTIGKTYLFLTDGQVGPYHSIINNTQFAYDTVDPEKTRIQPAAPGLVFVFYRDIPNGQRRGVSGVRCCE
ncbi:MAG: hypothetical protein IKT34_00105, partial [Clostridia bacterium]|nr:hypothetical protein [Clostridia bacterium]